MTVLINSYRYAAAGGVPPITWTDLTSGALVNRSSNVAVSANAAALWDNEIYDTSAWHDGSSNTERLTVPSGVSLVRMIGNARSSTGGFWYGMKNGAAFDGQPYERSDTAGDENTNITSAIVAVSASDYFTFHPASALTLVATGAAIANDGQTWFAIEAISTDKPYALVKKSADQAIGSANTWTALSWPSEVADTHSFHDNASNNSRLTVPAGVTLVRLSANVRFDSGGDLAVRFTKGGATFDGGTRKDEDGSANDRISISSGIVAVSPGDYFECEVSSTGATGSVIAANETWFQIEAIHPDTKYAMVKTPSGAAAGFNTLSWGAEVADTHAFHDNSTNPSRLTIPAGQGITQARLSIGTGSTGSSGQSICRVIRNGDAVNMYPGLPMDEGESADSDGSAGMGAWIDVTAGDYFEAQVFGAATLTADHCWFCVECR